MNNCELGILSKRVAIPSSVVLIMDKEQVIEIIDRNVNVIEGLIYEKIEIWVDYVLFSPLWWLGIALSIVPWIVWGIFRKKNSTARLLLASFFVIVVSLILDVLGDQLAFWHYRFHVIPILPTYLPWDLTLMPVTAMSILQIKPKANPYLKAVIFALLASYVGEPAAAWLDIYEPKNWQYTYSVPIQFLIYVAAHYISSMKTFEPLER